jgi:hypothetical protein
MGFSARLQISSPLFGATPATSFGNLAIGLIAQAAYNLADGLMPTSCTFDKLYVEARQTTDPRNYTFTLFKNSGATAMTCSLTTSTIGTVTCQDIDPGHQVGVSGGVDTVALQIVNTTGGASPSFHLLYSLNCR